MLNKLKSGLAIVISASALMDSLEAVQITREFYPAHLVPEIYDNQSNGDGDVTIIKLKEWPANSTISVFESRLTNPGQIKKIHTLTSGDEINEIIPTLVISSIGYIPGDQIKITFNDSKKKMSEEVTVIPRPIIIKSLIDNAKIQANITSVRLANYEIKFEGFGEKEELFMNSSSYDEHMEAKVQADKTTIGFMPGVVNKKGGIAKISFTRPSGEILNLELPWGLEWIKYMLYVDANGKVKSIIESEEYRKENPNVIKYFDSKR